MIPKASAASELEIYSTSPRTTAAFKSGSRRAILSRRLSLRSEDTADLSGVALQSGTSILSRLVCLRTLARFSFSGLTMAALVVIL